MAACSGMPEDHSTFPSNELSTCNGVEYSQQVAVDMRISPISLCALPDVTCGLLRVEAHVACTGLVDGHLLK